MAQYIPQRIDEEYGGITPYLDKTADKHNGIDAAKIKQHWNWGNKPHMSVASLALMSGVTRQTMDDWLTRLHEEAGIERVRPRGAVK